MVDLWATYFTGRAPSRFEAWNISSFYFVYFIAFYFIMVYQGKQIGTLLVIFSFFGNQPCNHIIALRNTIRHCCCWKVSFYILSPSECLCCNMQTPYIPVMYCILAALGLKWIRSSGISVSGSSSSCPSGSDHFSFRGIYHEHYSLLLSPCFRISF